MNRQDLLTHFGYNQWANQRILTQMAKLSEAQLDAPSQTNHGSAFELLRHMLDTEWGWRVICEEGVMLPYLWEVKPLPDLDAIVRFWQQEHEHTLSYLQSLSDDALEQDVDFGMIQGNQPRSAKLWHLLTHILYHSANHRSELARYLTECGHSPGNLDFLDYLDSIHH